MKLFRIFFLITAILWIAPVRAAVLLEDDHKSSHENSVSTSIEEYAGSNSLRTSRRIGVGILTGSVVGVAGINAELNFSADTSVGLMFGGGPHFQSFAAQIKQVFGDGYVQPYVAGGYARWYTTRPQGPLNGTTPGFLGGKFLDPGDRNTGDFAVNLLYPSAGLQYMQLSGPYTGSSLYIEITGLLDLNHFLVVPTAGLGAIYYF